MQIWYARKKDAKGRSSIPFLHHSQEFEKGRGVQSREESLFILNKGKVFRKEDPVKGFQILRLSVLCLSLAELGIKRPPSLAGNKKGLLGLFLPPQSATGQRENEKKNKKHTRGHSKNEGKDSKIMVSPLLPVCVLASASFSLGLGLVDPVAGLSSTGPLRLPLFTAAPGNVASLDGTALYQTQAERNLLVPALPSVQWVTGRARSHDPRGKVFYSPCP